MFPKLSAKNELEQNQGMLWKKKDHIYNLTITIDNHTLDQVESFRYLVNIISQDGKCAMEIKSRIAQAKTV